MRAVVDRIEGKTAVLLLGDEEMVLNVPRETLPQEVQEGSILRLRWEICARKTEVVTQEMERRIRRLKERGRG